MKRITDDTEAAGIQLSRIDRCEHTRPVRASLSCVGGATLAEDGGEISFYVHYREVGGRIWALCEMSTDLYRLLRGEGEPENELHTLIKIGRSYYRRDYRQDYEGRFDSVDEAIGKALSAVAVEIKVHVLSEQARAQRGTEKMHRLTRDESTSDEHVRQGAREHYGKSHPSSMEVRDYRNRGNGAARGGAF